MKITKILIKVILLGLLSLQTLCISAQWFQQGLDIDGDFDNDASGAVLSLSADGTTLAISSFAYYLGGNHTGQIRVYKKINGNWTQQGDDIIGDQPFSRSGGSISLSADGKIIAIVSWSNHGGGYFRGDTRIYNYTNGMWMQLGNPIYGESDGDGGSSSVSISANGTIVAIGSYLNGGGGIGRGHVRIFKFVNNAWLQIGADIDGKSDQELSGIGLSISSDGTIVAIGASDADDGGTNSGQVRIFKFIDGSWIQLGNNINGDYGDYSGRPVALSSSGTTVAIGRITHNIGGIARGYVRIFAYSNGVWKQLGSNINGETNSDHSGTSVALSADGNIVAIGATSNDGGGIDRGHVRIYKFSGGLWKQFGSDIDGESNLDYSGFAVSLSGDGNTVAIGAPNNAGGGVARGHIRVYSYCSQYERILNGIFSALKFGSKKFYVCHKGISNFQVGYPDLLVHLAHGDLLGQCGKINCDGLEFRNGELDENIFVKEEGALNEIQIYPNPTRNILHIKLPDVLSNDVEVQIVNGLGQNVSKQVIGPLKIEDGVLAINVQSIPEGFYYLESSSNGHSRIKSFVKLNK